MKIALTLLEALFLVSSVFSQLVPAYHIQTYINQMGEANLNWELAPASGFTEDFNDGTTRDFQFWTPQSQDYPGGGYYMIDSSRCKLVSGFGFVSSSASAVYTGNLFSDFTCEMETKDLGGFVTTKGIIFRTSGPFDEVFSGYGFEIDFSNPYPPRYCVYSYSDSGHFFFQIYWTETDLINTGVGQSNILKVVAHGDTYDIYINGVYVDTDDSQLFSSGYVGIYQTQAVIASYDYITCTFDAELQDRSVIPHRGTPITEWLDEAGRPMDHPPVMADEYERQRNSKREILHYVQDDMNVQDNIDRQSNIANELDDFVEYRIYRDGVFIGATADTVFTDQLPGYGSYEYRVTAVYDPEGESIPSVAEVVTWNAVTYALEPVNYVVPWTGGTITYDALLFSELNQPFQNVVYKTFITMPDQTVIGPTFQRSFTLGPHAYIHIPEVAVQVPANAPPGNYFLTGKLFYQGAPLLEQTFQFDKMGGGE